MGGISGCGKDEVVHAKKSSKLEFAKVRRSFDNNEKGSGTGLPPLALQSEVLLRTVSHLSPARINSIIGQFAATLQCIKGLGLAMFSNTTYDFGTCACATIAGAI